ncbi:hypothetical protein [Amycolatopsis anabasis]|uniref:hypothetical protein n=1 Tax=Amycolatopsis anabasis TaxID=1840409 RepID=UPI00131BA517|nr:hypothetical protein [Amycolatopsis anabasis]
MSNVPPGAQRSADGNYWWDGTRWQLVTPQEGTRVTPQAGRQISEDGNYWWDGSQWQPMHGAGHGVAVNLDHYPTIAKWARVTATEEGAKEHYASLGVTQNVAEHGRQATA